MGLHLGVFHKDVPLVLGAELAKCSTFSDCTGAWVDSKGVLFTLENIKKYIFIEV